MNSYQIFNGEERLSILNDDVFDCLENSESNPIKKTFLWCRDHGLFLHYALNKDSNLIVVAGQRVVFLATLYPFEIITILHKCNENDPLTAIVKNEEYEWEQRLFYLYISNYES